MKVTLLNSSILTAFGTFDYRKVSLSEVRALISINEINSAIGHRATANFLTKQLGVEIVENRIQFSQKVGETAIVFKLKRRLREGTVLDEAAIEIMGYEFGVLRRIS